MAELDYSAVVVDCVKVERVGELQLPLVNRFYEDCDYKVNCGRQDWVFTLRCENRIVAAARCLPSPSHYFMLRNLCVLPELRNRGIASHLIRTIMPRLNPANCYCYALPHLKKFYLALDFKQLQIEQVPGEIGETYARHVARKRGWLLMGYLHGAC